jgi:SulP family sulfate permease
MASLAALLLLVAWNMSEAKHFFHMVRVAPKSDVAVLATTFALTLFVDLTVGIGVGMVLAAFLFMRRMSEVTNVRFLTREFEEEEETDDPNAVAKRLVPRGVQVYEIDGPFFFGAAEQFKETLGQVSTRPKVLIIRMRRVPAIDSTGMHALRELARRCKRDGTRLLLSDVHAQPLVALGRSDLLDEIGEENIYGNIDDALNGARAHLGLPPAQRPSFAIPTVARETPVMGVPKYQRGQNPAAKT